MKAPGHDPLLLAGKVIVLFMQGLMALAAVVVAITLPLALIFGADFVSGFADGSGAPVDQVPMLAIAGLLLAVLAIVIALFVFFGKLRAIIDTVAEGDAFAPANADRLNLMAWLLLGTQLLSLPAAGLGLLVAKWADQAGHEDITIEAGFDLTGILMVLVLFTLARVFRQGAAMRDDLEGTV
jgi:hypothetical protein